MHLTAGAADSVLRVVDPETLEDLAEIPVSTRVQVERALERAARSNASLPAHVRCRILADVADRVRRDGDAFASLISAEGIKTIREARREVERCAVTLETAAEESKRINGEVLTLDQAPSGEGKLGVVERRPAGAVVAMTPYNDPLNLVAHKLGPAVAAGCPIVLKPHPATPLSAIKLHQAFIDAGLPSYLAQLVHGDRAVGSQLVTDSRPRVVSFTGARASGLQVAAAAGYKKLIMELGGVATTVVTAGADLDATASAIHSAAFSAAGQNCVHAQRVIAEAAIADELGERLVALAEAMHVGPKADERTDMGCCIDDAAVRRIMRHVTDSLNAGGRLLTGGEFEGRRVQPTWIFARDAGNPLANAEVFGPVSLLECVPAFGDALQRLGNAGDCLHVAVFTDSIEQAMAVYDVARAGAVLVNESTDYRIDAMPFGGCGVAGMEREGIRYAIDALSEVRMLVLPRSAARFGAHRSVRKATDQD